MLTEWYIPGQLELTIDLMEHDLEYVVQLADGLQTRKQVASNWNRSILLGVSNECK